MIECPFCGAASETHSEHWPCPALPAPRPAPIDGVVADPDAGRYTERVTLRIPRSLETAIDELVDEGAYASRSQAIRAAAFEAFVAREHTEQRCAIADGGVGTNGDADPDSDADTDALDDELRAALIESDCHPDFRHYCGRAADQGGTPILESVRHLHDASDVARVPVLGTAIETTLWREGAERTLTKHGHVDETNATILEAIVEADDAASDLVTDGGVLPADDPRSIEHRLENADAQLECALERLDDTQEPWVANTIAAMLEDLRDLRTLLDGSTDRPEGRR